MSTQAGREPSNGEQPTGVLSVDQLSFLDLLYAVPVADLAMRVSGAELHRVSVSDWLTLAVILEVIVLSWIGLHKNRAAMVAGAVRDPIGGISFLSLRFLQFLIEVIIVCMYFAMGLEPKFPIPGNPATPGAPEEWITGILACIYTAYITWDLIDIWQTCGQGWCSHAKAGARVTLVFLMLSLGLYLGVRLSHASGSAADSAINAILLVFLWIYRVAQDEWGNTKK